MKVLVTGHRGFIGRHLERYLVNEGHTVVGVDRLDGNDLAEGPQALVLDGRSGIEVVCHLAGSGDRNMLFPDAQNMLLAGLSVLEACANAGIPVLMVSSSHARNPGSYYAQTKASLDEWARWYRVNRQLHAASVRLHNVYGPGQEQAVTYSSTVFLDLIRKAMEGENIYRRDGLDTGRDFIYIDDLVHSLSGLLKNTTNRFSSPMNELGSGQLYNLRSAAAFIQEVVENLGDLPSLHIHIAQHAGDDWEAAPLDRGRKRVNIEEGLLRMIRHMMGVERDQLFS